MPQTFPCPKCNRVLKKSGDVEIADKTFPVFQCDHCLVPWEFDGTTEEVAYTFAVDSQNRAFDPATDDPSLSL